MQAHNLPHRHARTPLSATLARMQQHSLPHTRFHDLPHFALLVVCARPACMQLHNVPHRQACGCTICHAGMHTLHYLPHRHACCCIICHHNLPHRHACRACSGIFYYTRCICHTGMITCAQCATQICMQLHTLLRRLYVPHKHGYICIICHSGMHVVAHSATQAICATHVVAIIRYTSWICPIVRHAVPYSATHAPHGLPHTHACNHIIRHTSLHAVACGAICCYTRSTCHTGMHAAAKSATHTGGRLQPVLMRHTPQLSVKTRGGGGGGGGGGGA